MPEEYIKRDLVLLVIEEVFHGTDPNGEEQTGVLKCHRVVREHPAADVALVVHGEWIETKDDNKKRCSRCDVIHLIAQYPNGNANYCPNCGAKMDGGGHGN